jgi:choline dehydrogenase
MVSINRPLNSIHAKPLTRSSQRGRRCSGCVLASKLSEDPNVSVLLLEGGGDDTAVSEAKVPLLCSKLFYTKDDWNYYTIEQPNLAYRSLYYLVTRSLGALRHSMP